MLLAVRFYFHGPTAPSAYRYLSERLALSNQAVASAFGDDSPEDGPAKRIGADIRLNKRVFSMRNAGTAPAAETDRQSPGHPTNTRAVMAGVLLALLLASLDQTVVATAMPKIIASLQGFGQYAWVTTIYMLASTVTVPIYGKLSDILGRKAVFLFGISVFLVGSVLSGTAQSMDTLILFRGLQGLGAGAMLPIALAIVGDLYPPKERGKIQGLTGAVSGVSSIIGPALGGWLPPT